MEMIARPVALKDQFSKVINVLVGERYQTSIIVHRDIICNASPVIALKCSALAEGDSNTIKEAVSAETFTLFVQWLYRRVILDSTDYDDEDHSIRPKIGLAQLYYYAHRSKVIELKNDIISLLIANNLFVTFKEDLTISQLRTILPTDDGLIQLLVDIHGSGHLTNAQIEDSIRENHSDAEFMVSVFRKMTERKGGKKPNLKAEKYFSKESEVSIEQMQELGGKDTETDMDIPALENANTASVKTEEDTSSTISPHDYSAPALSSPRPYHEAPTGLNASLVETTYYDDEDESPVPSRRRTRQYGKELLDYGFNTVKGEKRRRSTKWYDAYED